jgi:hypothetical protein
MAEVSVGTGTVDCNFDQEGIFHFRVQFYLDEFLTRLGFEDLSSDNPSHFLVNGKPLDDNGLDALVGQCYKVNYKPMKSFLAANGLLDQVLYLKIEAILQNIINLV